VRLLGLLPEGGAVQSGLVAGLLVVAATVVGLVGHGATPVRAGTDEVHTADLVCPGAVDRMPGVRSTIGITAAPPDGTATSGSVTLDDLAPGNTVRGRLTGPGTIGVDTSKDAAPAQLVRGKDGLAPGLAAELVTDPGSGAGNALSATPCAAPAVTQWFVGAATTTGRREKLVLANPETSPAAVDLRFWDETGPVNVPNSTDVAVPAGGVVTLPLDTMAPGHQRLAIEVSTTRGAVAAALHDLDAVGAVVNGDDWMVPVTNPDRDLVIPGLPDRTSVRKLYLVAPGESAAIVRVRLLTADNAFAPAGADTVVVPAGKVGEYDLSAAGGGQAAAVVVSADRPVLASVRAVRTEHGGQDFAWAAPVSPLSGAATVPDGRSGPAGATGLLLAAPGAGGVVRVQLYAGSGAPRSTLVRIPPDRAVSVDQASGGTGHFTLVVTPEPGSGPVYGERVLRTGGSGLAITPLRSSRVSVVVPAVVPDVTVVTTGAAGRRATDADASRQAD
jgi:hypothetical protein